MKRAPSLLLLAAVALAAASCGGSSSSSSQPNATPPASNGTQLALPAPLVPFGLYRPVTLVGPDTPGYAGPATPTSLDKVSLAPSERAELKAVPGLGPMLEKQGFGVVRSGSSLFQAEYEGNIYGGFPVYVTTDAAYNSWHLIFDKTLRDLEQKVLLPKLGRLVTRLVTDAKRQQAAAAGTPLAPAAGRVLQLYEVAAAALGQKPALGPLARRELALIAAHNGTKISPITGTSIDYSFFTPRGHYTLNADLRRFFVAMSVLGQVPFCLPGSFGCPGAGPTRLGILASLALTSDPAARALWRQIYEPTAFLVGLSDDYTPGEVAAAVRKAAPGGLKALATDAAVRRVASALAEQRPVRINPQRASIRIMGTRFVTDEFLLDQLVYPHVGTQSKPRLLPSAVDLASTFSSAFAGQVMANEGAPSYANYDSQVKADQAAVAERPAEQWGSTVYDAWLYALEPVFEPHGKTFPDYMRTDAWAAKDLQSGLGSYTELKHDTILFAKQLVAEAGGDFSELKPLNWVEPDPVAFERLAAGADLLRRGLARRGLLSHEAGTLLATEIGMLHFLGGAARVELQNKPLPPAWDKRLRSIGDELAAIWWRTSQRSNPNPSIPDQSAVVADIATSPKGVLEIATGEVDTLYVIVPARNGGFELARGGVYSYYEFTSPPGVRLSDEAWRTMLEAGRAPARPSWESSFLVACPSAKQPCSPSYLPG
jgi:hypothetical protein